MGSTVYLHVGQAGNEIGGAFWRLASAEKPPKRWLFDERGRIRAVLVDTEPKVVRGVVRSVGEECVHPRCALVEQSGRGNNWAMGFHGTAGASGSGRGGSSSADGPSIADATLEALRWQWERCDWCNGLVLCHALGGGTGSGLGSRLLQELRDEHPRNYITSLAVGPFAGGELPLSSYNATLSLAHLQEHCDSVLLFDNAQLLRQLQAAAATASHAAAKTSAPPRLCMAQLDAYVANALAGLTFPTDGVRGRRPFDAGELVGSVCPMSSLKFLSLATAPTAKRVAPELGSVATANHAASGAAGPPMASKPPARPPATKPPPPWSDIVNEVAERTPRYDLHQRSVVTLGTLAVARGVGIEPPDVRSQARLQTLLGASPVTPQPLAWQLSTSSATALPAQGTPRTLTLASNRCSVAPLLEQTLLRVQLQLANRAYLHHYERYGVGADEITSRIEVVQRVIDDYNAAAARAGGQAGARRGPLAAVGVARDSSSAKLAGQIEQQGGGGGGGEAVDGAVSDERACPASA